MKKELQREEKLKKLNEIERQKARDEYIKKQQEQAKNNGMHHPVSTRVCCMYVPLNFLKTFFFRLL